MAVCKMSGYQMIVPSADQPPLSKMYGPLNMNLLGECSTSCNEIVGYVLYKPRLLVTIVPHAQS